MHEVITVQKFSENEWLIDGILEGNQNAENVVIMLHEGGYNRDENGLFPVIEGSVIKKENNKKIEKYWFWRKPLNIFSKYLRLIQSVCQSFLSAPLIYHNYNIKICAKILQ